MQGTNCPGDMLLLVERKFQIRPLRNQIRPLVVKTGQYRPDRTNTARTGTFGVQTGRSVRLGSAPGWQSSRLILGLLLKVGRGRRAIAFRRDSIRGSRFARCGSSM